MGKTYRASFETLMKRYNKIMEIARSEFERLGEVSDETDRILCGLEAELALLECGA